MHLFEGFGVEIEYMIANRDTLDIWPVSDKLLQAAAGTIVNEFPQGDFAWSNELVLHVLEIKTNGPAVKLEALGDLFHKEVLAVLKILVEQNALLIPTAMHPWMDPIREVKLWPHEYNPIYEAYNRIFDCRGHGWANLQSTHINLPFKGDDEFARLHAACRIILPLIPALSASSPIADSEIKSFLDYRMEMYRTNSIKIPSITGLIIPEPVFSEKMYKKHILEKMYRDIRPYDQDGILQFEWLNSRGALSRFDRGAIEIRIIDVQETPHADIAILSLIVSVIRNLTNGSWCSLEMQKDWSDHELYEILMEIMQHGEQAVVKNHRFLALFGLNEQQMEAGYIWSELYNRVNKTEPFPYKIAEPIQLILDEGPLARRILKSLHGRVTKEKLRDVYRELSNCLQDGRLYHP